MNHIVTKLSTTNNITTMSQTKQTRRELLEIEVRVNELDRAQSYLKSEFYYERKEQLLKRKEDIQEKLERKELAPDIQFLIVEDGVAEINDVDFELIR